MAKIPLRAYINEIETIIEQQQTEEAIAHCRHILLMYPKHIETFAPTAGFVALFDGKSSKGWRSINSDHFPETAWQIKNNILITNAPGGAEGETGGNIISTEKYGNFDLRWEYLAPRTDSSCRSSVYAGN